MLSAISWHLKLYIFVHYSLKDMHLYGQFITKITTIMTYKITLQMQRTVYAKMWVSLVDITYKFVHLIQRLY